MTRRKAKVLLFFTSAVVAFYSEAATARQSFSPLHISVKEWREANRLFRTDPRWVGCESAASFKLLDGRIVWLFAESRIDPTSSGALDHTFVVHNSIALQLGTDPATAELVHFWDNSTRRPESFFGDGQGFWYWPVDGIEVGTSLLLLFFKVRPGNGDRRTEIVEWSVAQILNPKESPARWRFQWLPTPANQFGAVLGFGGLTQIGGYYLTGARLPDRDDELFLARWSLDRIVRNDFTTPQWWTKGKGWVSQEALEDGPSPVASDLEGSVLPYWSSAQERAFLFASLDGQPEVLIALQAPAPTGPWSDPEEITTVKTDHTLKTVSLSLCRGLLSGEIVLSAAPVSDSAPSVAVPLLFRLIVR
jgi:hypothetical protein